MQFFISAIQAALPEFRDVQLGVGWVHVQKTGTRDWVFYTQANGVGHNDVLIFEVRVSKRGRASARFHGIEEAFGEELLPWQLKQEPTGQCHPYGDSSHCYRIGGPCKPPGEEWNGLCVYQARQF